MYSNQSQEKLSLQIEKCKQNLSDIESNIGDMISTDKILQIQSEYYDNMDQVYDFSEIKKNATENIEQAVAILRREVKGENCQEDIGKSPISFAISTILDDNNFKFLQMQYEDNLKDIKRLENEMKGLESKPLKIKEEKKVNSLSNATLKPLEKEEMTEFEPPVESKGCCPC